MDAALHLLKNPNDFAPNRPEIRVEHRPVLAEIYSLLGGKIPLYPEDWTAIKLLEGDAEITEMVRQSSPESWERIHTLLMQHEDAYLDVAGGRYEWIGRMVRAAVVKPKPGTISITDRLDKVATHPFWGLVLLLSIFGLVFWLTYAAAMPLVSWLDTQVISSLASSMRQVFAPAPAWLTSLLVDGLIAGAGAVLALLPVLIIFFAVLGLLEDIGYLARSAYVMDRFMHWMGLHGRSCLPLFIGFGCNVPGILGARIVEERRARLLTILLTPLVPCTGRMAVIVFLTPAFFGSNAALITWGLVAGNILLLFMFGMVVNHGRVQRHALSLYHGNAALPPPKCPYHRLVHLAKHLGFYQESRLDHLAGFGYCLATRLPSRWRYSRKPACQVWSLAGTRRTMAGIGGLAVDCRLVVQFYR
jgi:ferrous iron transport protein B